MKLIIALLSLLMAACIPLAADLTRPDDISPREAAKEEMECERFAMQQVQMMGLQNNPFNRISIEPRIADCLRNLGWR